MGEENEIQADSSRSLILCALVVLIFCITFRNFIRQAVSQIWRLFERYMFGDFQAKYNGRMNSRKKALFFDGLSQMAEDAGRPLHVLEIGAGTGANFAYFPDGTTVACLEPDTHYSDELKKAAGRFPRIQLEKLHHGFAEDMAMIESGSIDAVVSTLVMCHVRNIDKCLQEIIRVLRPVRMKRCLCVY